MSAQAWALFDGPPDEPLLGTMADAAQSPRHNNTTTTQEKKEDKHPTPPTKLTGKKKKAPPPALLPIPTTTTTTPPPPPTWALKLFLPHTKEALKSPQHDDITVKTTPQNLPRQENPAFIAPSFSHPCLFQHCHVAFRPRVNNRGGGRGYMASKDIEPGTLLLSEYPTADIPDSPSDRDPAERCLLNLVSGIVPLDKAKLTLQDLKTLHPRSVDDIDEARKHALQDSCTWLSHEIASSPFDKELGLDDPDTLIRTLCALHFNGFVTGVYVYLAMINHSCVPNCVKWGARDGQAHSEVRATRFIRAGEEITLSYLVPACRSRVARRRALFGQFGFECVCDLCEGKCNVELEDKSLAQVQVSEELENELEYLEKNELGKRPTLVIDRAIKARKSAVTKGLRPRHLALARADMIIADTSLAILDEGDGMDMGSSSSSPLPPHNKVDASMVLQLLRSSLSLRQTQVIFFREGVPDYDRDRERAALHETRSEAEPTLHHISSAIGFLVGKGMTKELLLLEFETGERVFKNVDEAIACQLSCEKMARRIADLYE